MIVEENRIDFELEGEASKFFVNAGNEISIVLSVNTDKIVHTLYDNR
jgi:hypothetical protein